MVGPTIKVGDGGGRCWTAMMTRTTADVAEVDADGADSFAWKLAFMRRFDKSNVGLAYDRGGIKFSILHFSSHHFELTFHIFSSDMADCLLSNSLRTSSILAQSSAGVGGEYSITP